MPRWGSPSEAIINNKLTGYFPLRTYRAPFPRRYSGVEHQTTTAMFRMLCFSVLTTLLAYLPADAQWSLVVSAGVSPQQSPETPYVFANRSTPRNEFTFDL